MKYIYFLSFIVIVIYYVLNIFDYCFEKSKFMSPQSAVKKEKLMYGLVNKSTKSSEIPVISIEEIKSYLKKYPNEFSTAIYPGTGGRFFGSIRYFYSPEVSEKNAKDKNLTRIITGTYHSEIFGICGNYEGGRSFTDEHIYKEDNNDIKYNPYRDNDKNLGRKKWK